MKIVIRNTLKIFYNKFLFLLGLFNNFLINLNILNLNYIKIYNEPNFSSKLNNNFFKEELKKSKLYLEFGSGCSTLYAAKIEKKFISIEADKNFFNLMKGKLNNPGLRYYNIGLTSNFSIPLFINKKKILNYSKSIFEECQKKKLIPDLILVDGRFRVLVSMQAHIFMSRIKKNIKIIIDDYAQRYYYHILENFFRIKIIGNFGFVYGLKKNQIPKILIEKYLKDCR